MWVRRSRADLTRGGLASSGRRAVSEASAIVADAPEPDPRDDFAAVYEAHYQVVYRAVRGVVLDPDLAEDVTQDAFVKAYRARDRFAPTGRVEAWLCTIAVREAISRMRWSALQRRVLEATSRAGAARPVGLAALAAGLTLAATSRAPGGAATIVMHLVSHGLPVAPGGPPAASPTLPASPTPTPSAAAGSAGRPATARPTPKPTPAASRWSEEENRWPSPSSSPHPSPSPSRSPDE